MKDLKGFFFFLGKGFGAALEDFRLYVADTVCALFIYWVS